MTGTTSTMRAIRIHRYGGPDVLTHEEVPRPEAGIGEVLVRVQAAGVNPIDWQTRMGEGVAGMLDHRLPLILGWDVSGVVDAVGPGVDAFATGDDIFGLVRFPQEGAAYAEYVAAPITDLATMPASLGHERAAAMPLVALTAWQSLIEAAELSAGQRVLIHRAAGGVGHLAVQLAKWRGAWVIGTASARNAEFLRELGVDEIVDYATTPFEDVARDVDVVLDTVGDETRDRSWGVLKRGGVLVSIRGEPSPEAAAAHGVRGRGVVVRPDAGQLTEIARLIDAGHLTPALDIVLPLAEARAAHERSEGGHARGKIVLRVTP